MSGHGHRCQPSNNPCCVRRPKPEAVLELIADGQLITLTPTGSETGARNSELIHQLKQFARRAGGWKVFYSSSGFRLPDGSVLNPEQRRGLAPSGLIWWSNWPASP